MRKPLRVLVNIWSRRLHRWGAIAVMLPLLIVIVTGILLLVKKQVAWIQPPQARSAPGLSVDFETILDAARSQPQAEIDSWEDVDRLDVRPGAGLIKVHARNHWEVQVCATTARVLSCAYRRSDFIESLHDGSWFFRGAKLWVFLPSGVILLALWVTGVYLWILPIWTRARNKKGRTPPQGASPHDGTAAPRNPA
jgi:uncharacterized iron-regulated membrane protein